jgi:hypothetical protein
MGSYRNYFFKYKVIDATAIRSTTQLASTVDFLISTFIGNKINSSIAWRVLKTLTNYKNAGAIAKPNISIVEGYRSFYNHNENKMFQTL